MSDGGIRRVLPAQRRRPGLLTVLVRWRAEAVFLVGMAVLYLQAGRIGLVAFGVAVAVLCAVPPAQRALRGLVRSVVMSHRVRSAFVQAGVTDRAGRPPWIVAAWPRGNGVRLWVWLRSGTTVNDVRLGVPLVATACGAAAVEVMDMPLRPDRVVLAVFRPRWGWPGSWR